MQDDEQEIRDLVSTWMAATQAGDVQTVDWAFMWQRLTVVATAPDGAPPTKRAGHTLSVLKKENGRWVLARDANLLAPVA